MQHKRQTRGTLCEIDMLNLNKINNEMNILKMEEKQRQKVQKILGGTDYQSRDTTLDLSH